MYECFPESKFKKKKKKILNIAFGLVDSKSLMY